MDGLIRVMAEMAPSAPEDPEATKAFCDFFGSVRGFIDASAQSKVNTQGMIDSFSPIEGLSKDLRPQLRRLKEGLTLMVEAQGLVEEWPQLIERTGLVCDEELKEP